MQAAKFAIKFSVQNYLRLIDWDSPHVTAPSEIRTLTKEIYFSSVIINFWIFSRILRLQTDTSKKLVIGTSKLANCQRGWFKNYKFEVDSKYTQYQRTRY